jgi:hypothetical protein
MENNVEKLRKRYEGFKRGEEDASTVRNEALLVLKDAKERGNREVLETVEDMLVDLEFSIEENRCKCHQKCSHC